MSFTLKENDRQLLMQEVPELYVPSDNHELRIKYEASKRGGTCGPSTIAVLEHTQVETIIDCWCGWRAHWRGFSPIGEMKITLSFLKYQFKYVRAHKAKTFPKPNGDAAIVRLQWLKDDGTEYYWAAAGAHTHYVLMQKIRGEWWVFCNGAGWFMTDTAFAKEYIGNRGYVSSYLEISKPSFFLSGIDKI